ncbi:MAG: DUF1460 domain-containing protein [Muribaculaceae bacterium]|nr:DUF1460 domain-containing protein [Muribaculaceae bacterium]
MYSIFRPIFSTAIFLIGTTGIFCSAQQKVRFHNESEDTTRINELLIKCQKVKTPGEKVKAMALSFEGTPYVAHTLEGDTELVTVNIDELDCTTFVETVLALAYTAEEGRTSWRDFVYNLERIRYRNGELNGYPSRLHYISDWIVDNSHRGNLQEVTNRFPFYHNITKTLSFMTENRDKYQSLKSDSLNYERMKNVELGYYSHQFPYIKTVDLRKKETKDAFQSGDVVALVTSMKNLDVTHLGIIIKKDGEPYLLHASSSHGKVEVTSVPFDEFMKNNRSLLGVRVIRLKQ